MSKIHKLDLHLLRNGEHFEFMNEFQNAITRYTTEILGITSEYPLFELTMSKEELAYGVEQGSIKSETINAYNKKRVRIWKSVKHRIESAILSPISEEVESGEVLKRIFTKYGNLPRKSVNAKSALLTLMTEDLLRAEMAPHLQVVNLGRVIPELENENNNYITAVNDRNTELAGRNSRNVGRIRAELDPVYNKIIECINASLTLNIAQPAVDKFVSELNNRIKTFKTTLALRKTMSKKARQAKKKNAGEKERLPENSNLPGLESGI